MSTRGLGDAGQWTRLSEALERVATGQAPDVLTALTIPAGTDPVRTASVVRTPIGFVPISPSGGMFQSSFWEQNKALVIGVGVVAALTAAFVIKAW